MRRIRHSMRRALAAGLLAGVALLPACSKSDDSTSGPNGASAPGNGISPAPSATSPRANSSPGAPGGGS
ncbi:hypothetical protein [Burkholderia glumae]